MPALLLALGLVACGSQSEPVSAPAADSGQSRSLPPGGPAVLYAPPPDLPQIQNRDARFSAPFGMVSGTERYIDGEYLYTDFVFDDEATTYPDDFARYGNNAADLVEFRIATPARGGMALRFTLSTLMAPDSTIAVLAFDSDNSPDTGSSTLPRHPDAPFPGTDQVLTTWGTGAEWSKWDGTNWITVPLDVKTDLEANQITVTVPASVANPAGQWRATLALGLYDPAGGGWLGSSLPANPPVGASVPISGVSTTKIVNLGFRFNETETGRPYDRQNAALAAGEPTQFAHAIDFDLLRNRGRQDNVPTHGNVYRIFASRMPTVTALLGGVESQKGEGKNRSSTLVQYFSPLQPYLLHIPASYDPKTPMPLTFAIKGKEDEYSGITDQKAYLQYLGDDRNSIVLSPGARSRDGFYVGDLEYDLLETWNDVARHYNLDPKRTAVSGISMGGYGTYRLGLLYPHLFARAVPIAPAICNGARTLVGCTGEDGGPTSANLWVENARNLPIFHIADTLSEVTPYTAQYQQVLGPADNGLQSLESNGYRYKFWTVVMDHALAVAGNDHPAITAYLDQHEIEPEPFHVTYARMPSNDHPLRGLVHNRAYWLSEIELRDASAPLAKGVVDAVSLGFGKSDPASAQSIDAGVTGIAFPYVEHQRTWDEPGTVPVENRIVIKARNIASLTIDPAAARVDCKVKLDIDSDGPMETRLRGCR